MTDSFARKLAKSSPKVTGSLTARRGPSRRVYKDAFGAKLVHNLAFLLSECPLCVVVMDSFVKFCNSDAVKSLDWEEKAHSFLIAIGAHIKDGEYMIKGDSEHRIKKDAILRYLGFPESIKDKSKMCRFLVEKGFVPPSDMDDLVVQVVAMAARYLCLVDEGVNLEW